MTYEELETRLTTLLQQPDSALALVGPLLEDIKKDYEQIITLTDANKKQEGRIRDLQDTNMKLFLAQTGKAENKEEDDDEDLEGMDAIDSFVNKLNENDVDDGK